MAPFKARHAGPLPAVMVMIAVCIGIVVWFGWYTDLPLVVVDPDGKCLRVTVYELGRPTPRDCGWEKGRKYHIFYEPHPTLRDSAPPGGKG